MLTLYEIGSVPLRPSPTYDAATAQDVVFRPEDHFSKVGAVDADTTSWGLTFTEDYQSGTGEGVLIDLTDGKVVIFYRHVATPGSNQVFYSPYRDTGGGGYAPSQMSGDMGSLTPGHQYVLRFGPGFFVGRNGFETQPFTVTNPTAAPTDTVWVSDADFSQVSETQNPDGSITLTNNGPTTIFMQTRDRTHYPETGGTVRFVVSAFERQGGASYSRVGLTTDYAGQGYWFTRYTDYEQASAPVTSAKTYEFTWGPDDYAQELSAQVELSQGASLTFIIETA